LADWVSTIVKIAGIFVAGLLMVLLGKLDQKKKLSPYIKLSLQAIIALLVILVGVRIEFLRGSSGTYWYLANLSIPITIVWLLIITNSVGQTDELSDITPIIVFIASITFLFVSIFQRQGLLLAEILSVGLAIFSLAIIYLRKKKIKFKSKYNYFSVYYMFFGFMLAIIAIVGVLKSTAALTLLTPFLILGLPIIDTSYSFIAGYLREDYLGTVNESKIRQQLINQGFSLRGANMIIVSTCIYLSLIAIVISIWEDVYLFTIMIGMGYLIFYWLKQQVVQGKNIIYIDEKRQKVSLFGVPIDRISCQNVIERFDKFVSQRKPSFVVTPDTLAILRARKDKEYLDITKKADLVTPDGAGILWATATLDVPLIERITGIDLINEICTAAVEKDYKLYLLGSENEVIDKAVRNLKDNFPGINIVGYYHGYFDKIAPNGDKIAKSEKDIIKEIKEKKPDFLLVGLGVPKQELWIAKHKDKLGVPVCIGIGGSFDVLSGKIPRAPLWMQNHGMEWIFRLIKEPKRLKRVIALPYFMWLIFLGKIELFFRTEGK
jgi:exopolysaccharide biosynthesis WecB/TagA/CpsF family protein